MDEFIPVGLLGATGTVGQRFISLLDTHPQFRLVHLAASPRSMGKTYAAAVHWKLGTPIPPALRHATLLACDPDAFSTCRIVFSGLDADVAGEIEEAFRQAGFAVFSNARNFRMHPEWPLVVPVVNPGHFSMLTARSGGRGDGFIVTNANCSTTGLVVPLKALETAFGSIDRVMVTTLQAVSGAGYPGVPSLDIMGNIVPEISGEEDKMEREVQKILAPDPAGPGAGVSLREDIRVSACCNRVPVLEGHTECVSLSFKNRPPPTPEQVSAALKAYTPPGLPRGLHSCPPNDEFIHVCEATDRPQPRLDRDHGRGMSVCVGRVRGCKILDVKFTLLVHNTVLGAAGSSIMNAEIAHARGLI